MMVGVVVFLSRYGTEPMIIVGEPVGPVVDLVSRYGSWLVSGAGVVLEDPRRWGISPVGPVGGVVSPGARDGGLTDGVTDERRWGMSPISPVGTGPGPVGRGPEGLVPGPAVGLSVGLGGGVVATMSMGPLGPPVGGRGLLEVLLHLQTFFLGKHFSAGLSS